jgi:hypothetical protein
VTTSADTLIGELEAEIKDLKMQLRVSQTHTALALGWIISRTGTHHFMPTVQAVYAGNRKSSVKAHRAMGRLF